MSQRAGGVLDFGQPVAVMLLGILQGIPDQDEPGAIIARLMDTVTPGSYLAISQIASDVAASEVEQGVQRYNDWAAVPVAARTHAEVCRFFTGLELVEPGVVQVHRWRAGTGGVGNRCDRAIYAGVAETLTAGRCGRLPDVRQIELLQARCRARGAGKPWYRSAGFPHGRPGAGIAAKSGTGSGLGQGSSRRTSQRGLPPRWPEVWRTRSNPCASNSWTVPT